MNDLITTQEAAQLLKVSDGAIRSAIRSGHVKEQGRRERPGQGGWPATLVSRQEVLSYREGHKRPGWTYEVRTPRNGAYFRAMLVGGPQDIARELRIKLASFGILVRWHCEYKKTLVFNRPIPKHCELIIILKDMISHAGEAVWVERAKQAKALGRDVTFVRAQRKATIMPLKARGFILEHAIDLANVDEIESIDEPEAPGLSAPQIDKLNAQIDEAIDKAAVVLAPPVSPSDWIGSRNKEVKKAPSTSVGFLEAAKRANLMFQLAQLKNTFSEVATSVLLTENNIEIEWKE